MKKYMLFIALILASLACEIETNVKRTVPTATPTATEAAYSTPEISAESPSVLDTCIDGTNCK